MKQIELTEKHKSKLLEMCKVLFPETHAKTWDIDEFIDYEPIDDENFQLFHWFEFCMTHLQDKIKQLNGFENNPDCDIELMSCWYENHPVDYLYEEFKKLKL